MLYENALEVLEEVEFKKMLSGEEDQLKAVIEINPGRAERKVMTGPKSSCVCTLCGAKAKA